ncbi:unnamed protein product [Caenorhabditis angaria]|uniref:methylated diphthine methylhydrolase n=1 Tax=Caenorhabditis angaria TaxID=860376 RepID=A0A9P1IKC7_9PELO|nr:unnamed protein product [Caenorhabditis angaria]
MSSSSKSIKLTSRPAFARHIPTVQPTRSIISTYLLDQQSDSRTGSLVIIEIENGELKIEKEISTSAGVFRFDFRNESQVIAALTDGSLAVQNIDGSKESENIPVSSDMLLDLALSDSSLTATTDNKGMAYVVDLNTSLVVSSWLAHSLPYVTDNQGCEVWSCTMNKSGDLVATGGEDASMKFWDVRTRTSTGQCKLFEAGVVFVDFWDDNQLITGSYDEYVRILDRRNLKQSVNEKKLSGGVWNIERSDDKLCVACMYGGYMILDQNLETVRKNEDAGRNLLYGATLMADDNVIYCTFNDYLVVLE